MALDRFAYVYNNPIRYIDPSGHFVPDSEFLYSSDYQPLQKTLLKFKNEGNQVWSQQEKDVLTKSAENYANALARDLNWYYGLLFLIGDSNEKIKIQPEDVFYTVFDGPVTLIRKDQTCEQAVGHIYGKCSGWAYTRSKNEIWFFENATAEVITTYTNLLTHELMHAFENSIGYYDESGGFIKPARDLVESEGIDNREGFIGPPLFWQLSIKMTPGEIFADMGVGWVHEKWEIDIRGIVSASGAEKANFMKTYMVRWILGELNE
jgi:hypothetical protein